MRNGKQPFFRLPSLSLTTAWSSPYSSASGGGGYKPLLKRVKNNCFSGSSLHSDLNSNWCEPAPPLFLTSVLLHFLHLALTVLQHSPSSCPAPHHRPTTLPWFPQLAHTMLFVATASPHHAFSWPFLLLCFSGSCHVLWPDNARSFPILHCSHA